MLMFLLMLKKFKLKIMVKFILALALSIITMICSVYQTISAEKSDDLKPGYFLNTIVRCY